eukprot:6069950-Amphidinium_carterae.2
MDTQRVACLLASQDVSEEMETNWSEPGLPAFPLETEASSLPFAPSTPLLVPGVPAPLPLPASDAEGSSLPPVPEVGEEVAALGQELGTALAQRRTAERRSIFAQRGSRGPDDSPFEDHIFDVHREYRGVEWGYPVPQEEWERR